MSAVVSRATLKGGWPAQFFNRPFFRTGPLSAVTGRLIAFYSFHVVRRTFFSQVLRRARRMYLGTFDPNYITQSAKENREGECHRCGLCCELIYKCPFLGNDPQGLPYCRIYGNLRPTNCHTYPFDKVDAEIDECGFKIK